MLRGMTRYVYVLGFAAASVGLFGCPKSNDAQPSGTASASAAATVSAAPSAAATVSAAASATETPAASATAAASASAAAGTAATGAAPTTAKSAAATAADAGPACGGKTNPCPLQAWMKSNANTAVASGDGPTIAKSLEDTVRFAPPGYPNWASISNDGAKAARSGNIEAAKAACRTCHDQYKERYKKELRDRKI